MAKKYLGYFLVYTQIFIILLTMFNYLTGYQTSKFTNGTQIDHFYNHLNSREVIIGELIGNIIGVFFSFCIFWLIGTLILNYQKNNKDTIKYLSLSENSKKSLPVLLWCVFILMFLFFKEQFREFEIAVQCIGLFISALCIFLMRDRFDRNLFHSFFVSILIFEIPNIDYVKNYVLLGHFYEVKYIPLW